MKFVQGSFFAGEQFTGPGRRASTGADTWCRAVGRGRRVHGTTRQRPAQVFAVGRAGAALLPAPRERYQVPRVGARSKCTVISTC